MSESTTKKRKLNPTPLELDTGFTLRRIKNQLECSSNTLKQVANELEEFINKYHNLNKELENVPESTYTLTKDSGHSRYKDNDLENVKMYLNYKQKQNLDSFIRKSKSTKKPGNLKARDIHDKEIGKSENYKKYINDVDRYNSHLEARNIVSSVKRESHIYGGSKGKELFLRLSRLSKRKSNPKGTIDGSKKKRKTKKRKSSVNSSKKHKRR
jgi:hypothetical protein